MCDSVRRRAPDPDPGADDDTPFLSDDPDEGNEDALLVDGAQLLRALRERIGLSADGVEGGGNVLAAYFPSPFLFCLHCDVTYGAHQTSDFGKLATLGSEGRSTATTLLGLSTVRRLRRDTTLAPEARKLLSFTDSPTIARTHRSRPATSTTSSRSVCSARRCCVRSWTPAPLASPTIAGSIRCCASSRKASSGRAIAGDRRGAEQPYIIAGDGAAKVAFTAIVDYSTLAQQETDHDRADPPRAVRR